MMCASSPKNAGFGFLMASAKNSSASSPLRFDLRRPLALASYPFDLSPNRPPHNGAFV